MYQNNEHTHPHPAVCPLVRTPAARALTNWVALARSACVYVCVCTPMGGHFLKRRSGWGWWLGGWKDRRPAKGRIFNLVSRRRERSCTHIYTCVALPLAAQNGRRAYILRLKTHTHTHTGRHVSCSFFLLFFIAILVAAAMCSRHMNEIGWELGLTCEFQPYR